MPDDKPKPKKPRKPRAKKKKPPAAKPDQLSADPSPPRGKLTSQRQSGGGLARVYEPPED